MTEKKAAVKAGQYWAVANHGNNGDLIVGRVESVRKNGKIILVNLLNARPSTKDISILTQRNRKVTKAQACEIQAVYAQTGDRQKARAKAVEITRATKQEELPLEQKPATTDVLRCIEKMAKALDGMASALIEFKLELTDLAEKVRG